MDDMENKQAPSENSEGLNSEWTNPDGTEPKGFEGASGNQAGTEVVLADVTDASEVLAVNESRLDSDQGQNAKTGTTKEKKHVGWWVLGAVVFVVLALVIGVWSGYTRGVNRRLNAQKDSLLTIAAQQLTLAYDDLDKNQLDTAKQRIEYILKIYPDFPGAQEMLVNIQIKMGLPTQAPATLALPPTETPVGPTPTPDLRGAEDLFHTAKALVRDQKWADALVNITTLREKYYDYKTAEVDGFYYVSLRNDGLSKIYNGKLEQGIWELNEAAQLGALDNQAAGAITLANMYVTGASYWDNNWPEAIRIFDELRQTYPNQTDATGMSTTERYRVALYKQGALFAAQNDFCSALSYYQRSLEVAPDQQISAQATIADAECNKPAPTAIVTPTPITTELVEPPTATPESSAPTATSPATTTAL
jgi:tetratricopeptide (TPR) repeat protein